MNPKQNIQEKKDRISTKKFMLEIKDLKKTFGNNHVLNGFNLELFEGENLVIMGNRVLGNQL